MKHRDKVAAVLVSAAGLALMSTGTAYAYWTTGGSGPGTADVGDAIELTSAAPTVTGELFPAGPAVSGAMQVTNPNAFPVKAISLTFDSAETTKAGCSTTGVTFVGGTGLNVVIPAGGTAPMTYTASMSTDSVNACQGATFTADFEIEAVSQ